MRMKAKIIAALALLFSVAPMAQADERDCLLVHMASGGSVLFPLSGEPMITFDGGVVTIATERYQVSDVRKYTFGNYAAGITGTENDAAAGGYSPDGRFFCVRLKDTSVQVRLYTAGGVEVPLGLKPDAEGVIRVDMNRLNRDVYLLTVGDETIKIRRQ